MADSKQKKSDPVLTWLAHVSRAIAYGVLFLFLVANIIFSQEMPSLYYSLAKNEPGSVVQTLQFARLVPDFYEFFPEVSGIMSQQAQEIYEETNTRKSQIDVLKASLQKHPLSPDILYALHILYAAEGQQGLADEYLQQARALDPTVGM